MRRVRSFDLLDDENTSAMRAGTSPSNWLPWPILRLQVFIEGQYPYDCTATHCRLIGAAGARLSVESFPIEVRNPPFASALKPTAMPRFGCPHWHPASEEF